MARLTEKDYIEMLHYTEGVLEEELGKSPDERDAEVVDECLETMVFVRQRLDACRREEQPAMPRRANTGAGSRRLRRIAIIAAIIAALLAAGVAAAEALGLSIGDLFVRSDCEKISLLYQDSEITSAIPAEPWDESGADLPEWPSELTTVSESSGIECYTEEELFALTGDELMYPHDTTGLVLDRAVVLTDDYSCHANMDFTWGSRRISIDENVITDGMGHVGFSGTIFGDYGEPETITVCGYDCAASEGKNGALLTVFTDDFFIIIRGRASIGELELILSSMLKGK